MVSRTSRPTKGTLQHGIDGERIRALRLERGLSERALAELAGVGRQTLRDIEASEDRQPLFRTIAALATALNVSIDHLLTPGAAA